MTVRTAAKVASLACCEGSSPSSDAGSIEPGVVHPHVALLRASSKRDTLLAVAIKG